MKTPHSLGKNTLYSAISSASNALLIVLVMLAARILGDESFGKFSFALAVASIFEMLTDLGLNTLTARNVARDKDLARRYLPNIMAWKIILAAGAMGLLVLSVNLLNQEPETRTAAYILGVGIVLRSFKATSHAFFQAHERFDLILLTTYAERLSVFVSGMLVLLFVGGLIPFVFVFALARVPDLVLAYWLVNRQVTPVGITLDRKTVQGLQMAALPFASYSVIVVLYTYIGTVVLSTIRSPEEVGWYNAGYKIYEGLTMLPALVCAVLLPRLSRLFVTDCEAHRHLSLLGLRYLTLVSFPVAVLLGQASPMVVNLLFGSVYLPSVPALRILLAAFVLMSANWTLNTILISADRQGIVVRIAAAGLLVMMCSNLVLVPRFGIMGAAASVLASETCIVLALLTIMRRSFPVPLHRLAWRPASACILAGAVTCWMHIGIPLTALAFSVFYTFLLLVLGAFDARELAAFRSLGRP